MFYLFIANVLVIVIGGVGVGIWYIFLPFAEPLLLVLLNSLSSHPLKKRWTNNSKNWVFLSSYST